MIWPQFTILPSSVICDGWFLCDSQLTQPGEGTLFNHSTDGGLPWLVTCESAEYFCVRLLDLYGPRAHLDVIISADDLSQWRDRINEALQEVDNVGV